MKTFKRGECVSWNSEAGIVHGRIMGKKTVPFRFKGYVRHASKEDPRYMIRSPKTGHVAVHRGSVLRKIGKCT